MPCELITELHKELLVVEVLPILQLVVPFMAFECKSVFKYTTRVPMVSAPEFDYLEACIPCQIVLAVQCKSQFMVLISFKRHWQTDLPNTYEMLLSDEFNRLADILRGEHIPQIIAKLLGCEGKLSHYLPVVLIDHIDLHGPPHQLSAILHHFKFQLASLSLKLLLLRFFSDHLVNTMLSPLLLCQTSPLLLTSLPLLGSLTDLLPLGCEHWLVLQSSELVLQLRKDSLVFLVDGEAWDSKFIVNRLG